MSKKIRIFSQLFFFVLIGLIAINHTLAESGNPIPLISTASFHAICPFGGVEALFAFINYDVMIPKIHESAFVILGIILFISILVGPVVCSYACPLGSVQEWFGKIGKRIFKKKYNHFIPYKYDKYLRYLRYVSLIFTIYLTTSSLKLVFLEVDPYYALFHFWTDEATVGGIVVLVIVLLSSLFVERPWCKYACPFGAVLGLTNFVRIFKLKRNESTCISCSKCDHACPMNIEISTKSKVMNHQCISCNECTSDVSCPVPDTMVLHAGKIGGKR